jgi:hypothetical protein
LEKLILRFSSLNIESLLKKRKKYKKGVDKNTRVIHACTRFCLQRPQRKKRGFPRTHAGI